MVDIQHSTERSTDLCSRLIFLGIILPLSSSLPPRSPPLFAPLSLSLSLCLLEEHEQQLGGVIDAPQPLSLSLSFCIHVQHPASRHFRFRRQEEEEGGGGRGGRRNGGEAIFYGSLTMATELRTGRVSCSAAVAKRVDPRLAGAMYVILGSSGGTYWTIDAIR